MTKPAGSRKGGRSALAGLASFFRQLSLFDPAPPETTTPVSKPAVAHRSANPTPASAQSESFASLCNGSYSHIQVILKPRLWDSWRVAWARRNESLRLEIPAILEQAPHSLKESLLEWAVLVTRRNIKRQPELRMRRAELEARIREHLRAPSGDGDGASAASGKRLARNRRRVGRLQPVGVHHDLRKTFQVINARYFQGGLQAKLTWSARLGGLSTHSIAQDGEGNAYHLISISRGYDNPDVTPEILGGVVYHECLHIAIPPRRESGRRVMHGPDFRERERAYEHFEVWRHWHRHGLPKAVRRLGKSKGH